MTEIGSTAPTGHIATEAGRRCTFAVISHPDAGRSTFTGALALHARVITEAGAVHERQAEGDRVGLDGEWRSPAVSPWYPR